MYMREIVKERGCKIIAVIKKSLKKARKLT